MAVGDRSDGHGQRESLDAGEAVTDALGEHDVGGTPHGGQGGESDAGGISALVPIVYRAAFSSSLRASASALVLYTCLNRMVCPPATRRS